MYSGKQVNSEFLTGILAKNFGHVGFRSWQEEVVKGALNGTNTIVVQPTGNGKSLCYQFLPFATGGTAVVISPTLSLIHDQVEENRRGLTILLSSLAGDTVFLSCLLLVGKMECLPPLYLPYCICRGHRVGGAIPCPLLVGGNAEWHPPLHVPHYA